MKRKPNILFPVVVGILVVSIILLYTKGILPYELIPDAPFDLSILAMLAIFWGVYFILDRNLFKPLAEAMAARKERVSSADSRYEEAQRRLDEEVVKFENQLKNVREELRASRESLKSRLLTERSEMVAKTKEEVDRTIKRAVEQIDAETARARKELHATAERLARLMVEKVLRRKCA